MKTRFVLLFALAISLSVKAANPTCGLTIITHGFQSPSILGGGSDPFPEWERAMARAITNRIGASVPIYRVWCDPINSQVILLDGATSIDIGQAGGAIIMLDWSDLAYVTTITTQSVADQFFTYLFGQTHNGHSLVEIPIHMIGHSRGCSLNARLAYLLAGNGVLVEQVTTLDPHPVRPWNLPPGDDWIPETYINVLFADNYYQTTSFPAGMAIAGTTFQDLSPVLSNQLPGDAHQHVHSYYHGTIDLSATSVDDDSILSAWYQNTVSRDETGYDFSRFTNPLLAQPPSGINQFISGANGTGSRVSVDSPQQLWSNAEFDQRSTISSVITVGQTVDIPYYFADRNSQQTITFYTDADTNPFNGFRSQIGSVNQTSRPAGSIGMAIFQWTPTAADVGTHFIGIKGANASNARYDYYLRTITVQAAATPAPTISSVSPRTLNTLPLPQTQLITITGNGFTSSSRLTLNDGVNPPYTDRLPGSWTATQLTYNIAVGPNPATWTVKVVNGAAESLPYSFYVVSIGAKLTSLGVNGPAAISENTSAQFAATAYFSDGSQQTVTSSANWTENSGVTTISSTGLLSAGSVNGDTAVTVSASYTTGGITKSANANVTVVNSGSCGTTQANLVSNGDFESGSAGWTVLGGALISTFASLYHSATHYLWFGDDSGTDTAYYQTLTIPSTATAANLSFYYNINSSEPTSLGAYDTFSVTIRDTGGNVLGTLTNWSNLNGTTAGSYQLQTFNLLAYKGSAIRIYFVSNCHLAGSQTTNFRVDDMNLAVTLSNPVVPMLFGIGGPTNVAEGSTAQFNAIVVNCDGSIQSVTPTWSENSSATTISSSGLLSAGSVGSDTTVTITATYDSFPPLDYQITVVNSAASFSYLAISGPSSINENNSGQFTASAIFSDGSSQPVSPTWSENSAATSISGSGLLTAGEVSINTTATVSASYTIAGVTRNASQDVLIVNIPPPVTLSLLSISGPSSVNENSDDQYTATASFSDGSSQTVNATWSENSPVTSISIFGLLSASEVASDMPMTVSASYTFNAITRNASTNVTIKDVVQPTTLRVAFSGNQIVLTWPTNSAGFAVEYTTNVTAVSWTSNSVAPTIVNGQYAVTNPITEGKKFYRLRK